MTQGYWRDGKYTPPRDDPDDDFTREELARTDLYLDALDTLKSIDPMWKKNYDLFLYKWDTATRLWWIDSIEQQARDGKDTIGATLVSLVVALRLEGEKNEKSNIPY